MNIIFFSRSNSGAPHPFILEQAEAISRDYPVTIQQVLIRSGGIRGYYQGIKALHASVRKYKPAIVHAHYGLSGLAAAVCKLVFWHSFRIVITYHGSDLNKPDERRLSILASYFAFKNILVSESMKRYVDKNHEVIPCGIDTQISNAVKPAERKRFNRLPSDLVILFSSSFTRPVKDPDFAFRVIERLRAEIKEPVYLIELKGYNRREVSALMQMADALLLCSKSEGSPQVVKEAILHGLPIVANDVGEVKMICEGIDHCHIKEKTPEAFTAALKEINRLRPRIQQREKIITQYDNRRIAAQIIQIYAGAGSGTIAIANPSSKKSLYASHI